MRSPRWQFPIGVRPRLLTEAVCLIVLAACLGTPRTLTASVDEVARGAERYPAAATVAVPASTEGSELNVDQHPPPARRSPSELLTEALPEEWNGWVEPERLAYSAQLVVTMTLLGLVPAFLLMTTSYIRISIVLSLLRQAFGSQLLPMQVTTALAMFCTGLVMWPTWTLVHEQAVVPIMQGAEPAELVTLWDKGVQPIRDFMVRQIDANDNADDVHLFMKHLSAGQGYPTSYDQVPLRALLPAFVLSELKTAFLIGFQIYLPFLVIDLVVATVTTSMGMFMLPPNMVSLPLKLLMFVMVDGWRLLVDMLMSSFQ